MVKKAKEIKVVKTEEIKITEPKADCPICHGTGKYPEDEQCICSCVSK